MLATRHRTRAFFLTAGLGLLAASLIILVHRPEPVDMRFREFLGGFMTVAFITGLVFILVFSNKWFKIKILGVALFGLALLAMYLGGKFGGQTVGSTGWVIGLILITLVFPGTLVLISLPGLISLFTTLQNEPVSKTGLFIGLGLIAVIAAVLTGITTIGPDLDKVIASANDPDPRTRNQAIYQLGRIDNVRSTDALVKLLHDPDPGIRAKAARALGDSPPIHHMAINDLTKALKDKSSEVRRSATISVGAIIAAFKSRGGSDTVEALIGNLSDEDPQVRSASAEVLGWIGNRKAIEPLIEALDDEAAGRDAHNALIGITGQRLSDDPAQWRAWLAKKK